MKVWGDFMSYVLTFLGGMVTGVILLVVICCFIVASEVSREEEEQVKKYDGW